MENATLANFNTITEREILYYAYEGLIQRIAEECDLISQNPETLRMNQNPENMTARIPGRYDLQLKEIFSRIVEIEKELEGKPGRKEDK